MQYKLRCYSHDSWGALHIQRSGKNLLRAFVFSIVVPCLFAATVRLAKTSTKNEYDSMCRLKSRVHQMKLHWATVKIIHALRVGESRMTPPPKYFRQTREIFFWRNVYRVLRSDFFKLILRRLSDVILIFILSSKFSICGDLLKMTTQWKAHRKKCERCGENCPRI